MIPTEESYKIAVCSPSGEPYELANVDFNRRRNTDLALALATLANLRRHPVYQNKDLCLVRQVTTYEWIHESSDL